MLPAYYNDFLYPLQDRVLKRIEEVNQIFYLSGGTALSRQYLHHRFSDDLDFFVNQHPDFQREVTRIIEHLKQAGFSIDIAISDSGFARLFVIEKENSLKIEWINDVAFSFGEKLKTSFFHRVDHWQNILSNKISALSRNEGKDFADILFLCKTYSFEWVEVISQAKEKDMWVDEIEISRLILDFPVDNLGKILWIKTPDFGSLNHLKESISIDILQGNRNEPRE